MRINVAKTFLVLFTILLCVSIHAQIKGTMIDPRDGQVYKTVEIGNQTWMAQNLNYEITDSIFYKKFIEPKPSLNQYKIKISDSYCYGAEQINCDKYGRLYSYDAAMKSCPLGWHLPDTSEYNALFYHLQKEAGNDKYKLYQSLLPEGSSGFDLLYAGFSFNYILENRKSSHGLGIQTYFLASDSTQNPLKTQSAYRSQFNTTSISLFFYFKKKSYTKFRFVQQNSLLQLSVRCIKDEE